MTTYTAGLSPADVVDVNVTYLSSGTKTRNFGALLIIGNNSFFSETEQYRTYTSLTAVAADFGTTVPEYAAAARYFGQSPTPTTLYIGTVRSADNETLLSATQRLRQYTSNWYAVAFAPSQAHTPADYVAVAQYIEGASPSSILCISTMLPATFDPTSTTDIGYLISQGGFNRTFVAYSGTDINIAVGIFALFATIDYSGVNTTITAKFKTLTGTVADTLTESQASALDAKYTNYYANYQTGAAYIQQGVMSSGRWIDSQIGTDAFVNAIQVAELNLLGGRKKIPQTAAGMTMMKAAANNVGAQFVTNGFLGEGLPWNGDSVGALNNGDTLSDGFYTYMNSILVQPTADRAARKATTMTICANQAGAVHSMVININMEQ